MVLPPDGLVPAPELGLLVRFRFVWFRSGFLGGVCLSVVLALLVLFVVFVSFAVFVLFVMRICLVVSVLHFIQQIRQALGENLLFAN